MLWNTVINATTAWIDTWSKPSRSKTRRGAIRCRCRCMSMHSSKKGLQRGFSMVILRIRSNGRSRCGRNGVESPGLSFSLISYGGKQRWNVLQNQMLLLLLLLMLLEPEPSFVGGDPCALDVGGAFQASVLAASSAPRVEALLLRLLPTVQASRCFEGARARHSHFSMAMAM